jgi:hypothetical protein
MPLTVLTDVFSPAPNLNIDIPEEMELKVQAAVQANASSIGYASDDDRQDTGITKKTP